MAESATMYAAIARAVMASGAWVRLEPDDFARILARQNALLMVSARTTAGGQLRTFQ